MSGTYSLMTGRLHKWPFFFYVLSSILILSNCKREEPPRYEKVLVEVNDFDITVFDFENEYIEHLIKTGRNDTEDQRYFFLNKLIDQAVFAQAASKTDLLDNEFYRTAIEFHRRKTMVDVFFADEMEDILEPITDEELRLVYAKTKRKVYVRHLFSRQESEVIEAYQQLENGENFIDVANEFYETAEYDSSAGYLGPVRYFGVDDAFAEASFATNQGEYSEPIRSRFGYHVIYVEYVEFPAMLAEDDYQYRKKGIRSQQRLRDQTVKADEYVRNLMGSLKVEISSDNILELRDIIFSLPSEQITRANNERDIESQGDFWNDQQLNILRSSYDNNALLASYEYKGERVPFTFGDYLKWLPYLPFSESKLRTGASVGRGLRNEVLFKMAEEQGYFDDTRVEKQVKKRGYEVLSDLYRHRLILEALEDTSPVQIPDDFRERLIANRQQEVIASYWKVKAGSMQEARTVKDNILNYGAPPEGYDSFVLIEDKIILPEENDYNLVRRGILETPVIAHSGADGWIVLKILSKTITEINEEKEPNELESRYKVFKNLDTNVRELRKAADIKVDSTLFDEIYELYKKKQQDS